LAFNFGSNQAARRSTILWWIKATTFSTPVHSCTIYQPSIFFAAFSVQTACPSQKQPFTGRNPHNGRNAVSFVVNYASKGASMYRGHLCRRKSASLRRYAAVRAGTKILRPTRFFLKAFGYFFELMAQSPSLSEKTYSSVVLGISFKTAYAAA
jgi:hypothetical protein